MIDFQHNSPDEHLEFNPRCPECREQAVRQEQRLTRPEWVKRAEANALVAKELSR